MAELYAHSPLAGDAHPIRWSNKAIRLAELDDQGLVRLQGPGDEAAFLRAAEDILGVALPATPCTSSAGGDIRCLWLNPEEWLLVTPLSAEDKLAASLELLVSRFNALVTLNTDARIGIRIEGRLAAELLAKGSTQDFHPGAYPPGRCTIARFNGTPVILLRGADAAFDLYVDRSMARHTWDWMVDAVGEFNGTSGS